MKDKKTKFVELANNRVNRTIKDLRLIGNLANKNNYEYDDAQTNKIIKVLQDELDEVKRKFDSNRSGLKKDFKL
ncbi:hypothetical protein GHNINEIG_00397 [Hydrogenovibrio crunogenus]|uniref:Uncharacterized protein n=1 Tax=Hydrogenovibrio crunogenus TaxID=39765 RepID=A0A4P7NXC8_9GAMM|nr:hypothetical protein [Hydrogenovibrio crunogenus]QBZ82367.1 hypothetical protein GHNINEIG_00397 [Hydrogenovibrio crunogenus]